MRACLEAHAFRRHLFEAPVQDVLFHLEIRNAVAHQTAKTVIFFKDGDQVSGAIELLGAGQPRGAGADYGDSLACTRLRRFRLNPALQPGALDNTLFNDFDRDRRLVDSQHARGLAGSGTDAPRKFGKIIGRMQNADGFLPMIAIDEVIPVGNDIIDGASRVAEGNAAIHTARRLRADFFFGKLVVDLEVVVDALFNGAAYRHFPREFFEPGHFTHEFYPRTSRPRPCVPACAISTPAGTRGTPRTRLYSCGNTLTNFGRVASQPCRIHLA